MIRASLRCFGFGVASAALTIWLPFAVILVLNCPASNREPGLFALSWIPVASLTFSMIAWSNVFQAQSASHGEWNPAFAQLIWGRILSALGVLISVLFVILFVAAILGQLWQPD